MTNGSRLFSDVAHADVDPKPYLEPEYRYLDRSARVPAERVREVLEALFVHYPDEHRSEFVSRFQSDNDVQFTASVFELYLHELLVQLGYSVEIHRGSESEQGRRPDFYVTSRETEGTYIEAVVATGLSDQERGAISRKNAVYDAINTVDSPDFFLWLTVRGTPETAPPQRSLRLFLEEWLGSLDYDKLCESYESRRLGGMPRQHFSHAGWRIEFAPIPKSPDRRGGPGVRPIGVTFSGLQTCNTKEVIRGSITRKGSRYGELSSGYIIAVDSLEVGTGNDHFEDALIGSPQMVIPCDPGSTADPFWIRNYDGVWGNAEKPKYTRIGAVMAVKRLTAWSLATPAPVVYINPWAGYPVTGPIEELGTARFENGGFSYSEGTHPRALLDLPEGWPEHNVSA